MMELVRRPTPITLCSIQAALREDFLVTDVMGAVMEVAMDGTPLEVSLAATMTVTVAVTAARAILVVTSGH